MAARRNIGPGFGAEAALGQSRRHYRAAGSFAAGSADAVVPQLQGGGFGGFGGLGGIFTDFGCYLNYSFCLAGCVWGWLGDSKNFPAPLAGVLAEKCVLDCQVDLLRCQGGGGPGGGIP